LDTTLKSLRDSRPKHSDGKVNIEIGTGKTNIQSFRNKFGLQIDEFDFGVLVVCDWEELV